jgi:hypothetical protein
MNSNFDDRSIAMIYWAFAAIYVLFWLVMVPILFAKSREARRKAGALLIAPVPLRVWTPQQRWEKLAVGGFVLYGVAAVFSRGFHDPLAPGLVISAVMAGFVLLRRRMGMMALELRSQGIVLGGTGFHAWADIKWFRWRATPRLDLSVQYSHTRAQIPLRPEDRDVIDRILSEHCTSRQPPGPRTPPLPCASS